MCSGQYVARRAGSTGVGHRGTGTTGGGYQGRQAKQSGVVWHALWCSQRRRGGNEAVQEHPLRLLEAVATCSGQWLAGQPALVSGQRGAGA
eukprot:15461720-Alexandrium_andersonii.AAC.1